MTAREEVLLRGLIDWVALERVHRRVAGKSQRAVGCHPGKGSRLDPLARDRRAVRTGRSGDSKPPLCRLGCPAC